MLAGDTPRAAGPYEGAVPFISDLLETESGVSAIGVAGYPDGHPMIDTGVLAEQLFAKRHLLASAGIRGWDTTQMCLDAEAVHAFTFNSDRETRAWHEAVISGHRPV